MRISKWGMALTGLVILVVARTAFAAELPENFPDDVPIGEDMHVVSATVVRDDMMVNLHAPGQTLADVVEWFQSGLTSAGWQSDGETVTERMAILAFSKDGRRCGVNVTNAVMNSSMQMDDSIKGITLQVSAKRAADAASAATASEAADMAEQQ